MVHSDREYFSAAINFFWGDGTASPESVNERSAEMQATYSLAYSDQGNKAFLICPVFVLR
ncbi:hypothetical protein [Marinobacter sp. ATCH36]|uniref:hypothetical protein n=1 Tax=Marinobacter sp. ATCH36 TaxID=2945106 RepID=UPI002020E06F|nr:hypothetical protein [Marinobacter sp. ATCH36]MCL7945453.1 hypothetical protein [Marinobacter sp. ATCH36]